MHSVLLLCLVAGASWCVFLSCSNLVACLSRRRSRRRAPPTGSGGSSRGSGPSGTTGTSGAPASTAGPGPGSPAEAAARGRGHIRDLYLDLYDRCSCNRCRPGPRLWTRRGPRYAYLVWPFFPAWCPGNAPCRQPRAQFHNGLLFQRTSFLRGRFWLRQGLDLSVPRLCTHESGTYACRAGAGHTLCPSAWPLERNFYVPSHASLLRALQVLL